MSRQAKIDVTCLCLLSRCVTLMLHEALRYRRKKRPRMERNSWHTTCKNMHMHVCNCPTHRRTGVPAQPEQSIGLVLGVAVAKCRAGHQIYEAHPVPYIQDGLFRSDPAGAARPDKAVQVSTRLQWQVPYTLAILTMRVCRPTRGCDCQMVQIAKRAIAVAAVLVG